MADQGDMAAALARVFGGDAKRLAGLMGINASMRGRAPERDAPVRAIPARLGDRWSALLLLILSTGVYRHAELKRAVSILSHEKSISQRMLTLRLRGLERDGLVRREVTPLVPPRVDYSLTPIGLDLTRRFFDLVNWIEENEAGILEARARFPDGE